MKRLLEKLSKYVGNTPLIQLKHEKIDLFAKLEYNNYSGSIKDRPALRIITQAVLRGQINEDTTVIESSSGNFAIALAFICRWLKIKFIAVIDPNINQAYEKLLNLISYKVIKVNRPDETGGYLLTRLEMVKSYVDSGKHYFWPNQYSNIDNYLSYYYGLGAEICEEFDHLDYAFIAVSSGGTIAGLSSKLKEKFPEVKIIGVDVEGSVIFGGKPCKRYISGIGASISSALVKKALIDEVLMISQLDIVSGCNHLLNDQMIFAGASSGAVYYAIESYFRSKEFSTKPKVVFPCPDKGSAYQNTIYNPDWKEWLRQESIKPSLAI